MSLRTPLWLIVIILFCYQPALAQEQSESTALADLQAIPAAVPQSADEAELKKLIEDFYAAYEKRDLPAMRRLWSAGAPATAAFEKSMTQRLKTISQVEVKFLRVYQIAVQGPNACVRAFAETHGIEAATGKPMLVGLGRFWRNFECVKEADGWKLTDWPRSTEALVGKLSAAATPAERERLWQAQPDLHIVEVVWNANQQGLQAYGRGEYARAARLHQTAYWLAEKLGNQFGLALALINEGVLYLDQNEYARALDYFLRALPLARALQGVRNQEGLAHLTNNIGVIYKAQGNLGLALQYLLESLRICEANHFKNELGERLINLAGVYQQQGQDQQARALLERSRALYQGSNQEAGSNRRRAETLIALAQFHATKKEYEQAAAYCQEALPAVQDRKYLKAAALAVYSQALYAQGAYAQAVERAEEAVQLAQETGQRDARWEARATQGQALRALGKLPEARVAFVEAIAAIEEIRANVAGGEVERQSFFARKVSPYRELVELLFSQQELAAALSYAERGKARALLDTLQGGRAQINKAITAAEAEQERKLNTALAELNSQLYREQQAKQADGARLKELQARLQQARLEQEDFLTRLYAAHPTLKVQRGQARDFQLNDLAGRVLDSQTALLEYVVTERKTLLLVVTRVAGQLVLRAYESPVEREALRAQISAFRAKLAGRDLLFRPAARQLYNALVKPAQAQLRGKTRLVIVPDGCLWELPFQALVNEKGRYLLEAHALAYAPSLSALNEMTSLQRKRRDSAGGARLLAFGNPALQNEVGATAQLRGVEGGTLKFAPLPQAEVEVNKIARLYGAASRVYVGAAAREADFKARAGAYDVLHLAAHGLLNDSQPLYSFLVLSQDESAETAPDATGKEDGLLEAWELLRMELKPRLVVLSACETARGQVSEGEGVIGLSWALFVAGAPAAVVSQWKVDEVSTSDLMVEFHRQLQRPEAKQAEAVGAAAALRQAALTLLRGQYRHPFYWAGFVVMGAGF